MKMMIWMMKTMTILILMDLAQVEWQEIVVRDFQWQERAEVAHALNLLGLEKVEVGEVVSMANVDLE